MHICSKNFWLYLFATFLVVTSACSQVVNSEGKLESLIIKKANGEEIVYKVELADKDATRRLGLMYRQHMPEDQGMVLDFKRSIDASIWMKNTYIGLDLLYINKQGVIKFLWKNAIPHDITSISSGQKIRAVLEINAGQIEKNGIKVEDQVIHPSFKN